MTNGDNGHHDPYAQQLVLAEGLPDATLIVYPNAGHGALFQYAPTYVAHVREFLRGA